MPRKIVVIFDTRNSCAESALPFLNTVAFPPHVFVRIAAAFYDISIADVRSPHRVRVASKPRHVIIAACALAYPNLSLPRLGQIFHRDHTTIIYALRATGFDTIAPLLPFDGTAARVASKGERFDWQAQLAELERQRAMYEAALAAGARVI